MRSAARLFVGPAPGRPGRWTWAAPAGVPPGALRRLRGEPVDHRDQPGQVGHELPLAPRQGREVLRVVPLLEREPAALVGPRACRALPWAALNRVKELSTVTPKSAARPVTVDDQVVGQLGMENADEESTLPNKDDTEWNCSSALFMLWPRPSWLPGLRRACRF